MSNAIFPIPYPDVNAALNTFLAEVQAVLGSYFVGLYVHGSLACGDFSSERSDIDFLVVTDDELPARLLPALEAMHARIFASGLPWTAKMEGAYIPCRALRRYDPLHAKHPWLGVDGHFAVEQLGSDWIIQCSILREKGIVLAGPPLRTLIDPVGPDDLRQAVLGSLREWWSPPFPSPERFQSDEYQAYAVLTMCRSLYVLQHGKVASKSVAARWAKETLGEPWDALIGDAADWQQGVRFDKYDKTMDFILYTHNRNQQSDNL